MTPAPGAAVPDEEGGGAEGVSCALADRVATLGLADRAGFDETVSPDPPAQEASESIAAVAIGVPYRQLAPADGRNDRSLVLIMGHTFQ